MNTRLLFIATFLCFAFTSTGQVSCPPNVDFEQGNYGNWSFYTGVCCPISTPTFTGPLSNRHVLTSGAGTDLYGGFPLVAPGGGSYSLKLGNNSTGAQAERARYYVHVPNNQNDYSLIYRYAVVFQNPSHTAIEQPRFEVTAYDSATNAVIPCAQFTYVATANLPGFALSAIGSQVWYKDWTTATLNLSGLAGQTIAVDFAAGDCTQGGHFGYGYLDMTCALFQIVTVNCNGSPTTALSAPPGFQTYTWWNSSYTTVVGTGQNVTIATPTVSSQYHVILSPYSGFGCPDTLTTTINVSSLNVAATNDTVICSGSSIPLSANAVSTSSTLNYTWAPSSGLSCTNCANPIATPTSNSTYYVTVSDGNGCLKSDTVQVNIDALSVTTSAQPVSCLGGSNGTIIATPTAGITPYSYSWNTTPVQTTATATGLSAGTYTVTVTDNIGCTKSATQAITQPSSALTGSISSVAHLSCFSAGNGNATVSPSGGIAPYTYTWNTSPVQTSSTASGLSGGSYTVTVTDNQGCAIIQTVTITEPSALTATNNITNLVCPNGNNGSATAVVTGGTTPYTYSWNTTPAQTSATINNLTAGTYIATVTDNHGCTTTTSATLAASQSAIIASPGTITNVSCFGGNNGTAAVNATGGSAPYFYSWSTSPAQTSQVAVNLAAGTYTVNVSDVNGCVGTASVVITQPATPVAVSINNVANIQCYGLSTGSATANATGGTPPYSYNWNTSAAQGTAIANNLSAGTYLVTVTDANGCTATQSVNITQPTVLNAAISSVTNMQCPGNNIGSASVSVTGGAMPYSYSWSNLPTQNGATINNLAGGTYTVTVTDNSGCSDTAVAVIIQPAPITVNIAVSNLFCSGGTNGSALANVIGGTAPYSFNWNTIPTQTTANATALTAGIYTVTITDANGCTKTASATIALPSTPINAVITSATPVLCNGSLTGTATAAATGGSAPYNYFWNSTPFQNTAAATGLAAGSYIVTVTDNNGCTDTAHVTISQPPTPVSISLNNTHVTCNGGTNGSATVSSNGGNGPYSYNWNTIPIQTSATATNLSAGTYTVSVTDANGCTATQSITITQPPLLNASIASSTAILCNGNLSGSASALVNGGVTPYNYSWNTVPVQTNATAGNLSAGTYVVTVTDNSGCTDTASITLSQPLALTASVTVSNLFCAGGANGSATTNAGGGTPPYSYNWNTTPIQTSTTATSLPAGTYTVTVTDANGCTKTASATIAMPSTPINASVTSITPVLCFGASTGSATVTASGGAAPYNYYWNSSPSQATATATGLPAGSYVVTVTDNNGCSDTVHVLITQPATAVNLSVTSLSHVACYGGNTGAASVSLTGGVAPYSYNWNTVPAQTASAATGLSAGTYIISVSDANGCSATQSVTITQPPLLNAAIASSTGILCNGNSTASASVSVTGGASPYSYSWNTSPVQITPTASNLGAGTYIVTVTDNNGCIDTAKITITQPLPFTVNLAVSNLFCTGGTNGSINANVIGGTPPYSYNWNTTPAQTSAIATALTAGTYTVTITDANGCTTTSSATIALPSTPINAAINNVNPVVCLGSATGSATATATGGTPPYNYFWNSTPFQNTATATGLPAGSYIVTVTDNNGCSDTAQVVITQPSSAVSLSVTSTAHVTCHDGNNGNASVIATGGLPPYNYNWNTAPTQLTAAAANLLAGTYTVTVTDANGCTATQSVTITQPPLLNTTIASPTNVSCNGGSTGSATAVANGGVSPYTYLWNTVPVQTNATAGNLSAGTYVVTVTDNNGCTDTAQVTITQPLALTAVTTVSNLFCIGGSNGSATAVVNGGMAPYTYLWNTTPAQTIAAATNLPAGTYTVTVTDANGCTKTASATIAMPSTPINASVTSITPVLCFGASTGSATVTASGGAAPYNYYWNSSPSQATATATGLPAGSYVVTVTDNNGCSDTVHVLITQPATAVNLSVTSLSHVACYGGNTGAASVSLTGGVAPYSYNWNTVPAQTASAATGLSAGTYIISVSDANGCSATQSVTITQPPLLNAAIASSTGILCNGNSTASASVSVTGGASPYSYSWNTSPVQITPTASNLGAGTYIVTVTDNNGCIDTAKITITQPLPFTVNLAVSNLFCTGGTNGSINANVIGGTPPYSYNWNTTPAQTSAIATALTAGTYTVTITDANGCTTTSSATIALPSTPINAAINNVNPVVCLGSATGSATATATGGTPPYNYFWNSTPFQNTATATGLPAGSYIVTVTDNNGCSDTAQVVITQPSSAVSLSVTSTAHVTCHDGNNGNASVIATGGLPPYNYNWNTAPTQLTAAAANLLAGTYTVTVTDANGCTATQSVTITQPPLLNTTIASPTNVSCNGGSTGSATAVANGGVSPYTYLWNTVPVQTNATAGNLSAGTYVVTVTDNNGCTDTAQVTITQPLALTAVTTVSNLFCIGGSNGSATAVMNGGMAPYTYLWNTTPAQTTVTANNLTPGTYTVTITDGFGCTTTASGSISLPSSPINASINSSVPVTCFGQANGSATVLTTGGTAPYTYFWNTTPFQTSATAVNLAAGTYMVIVTDNNGCSDTASVTITQPTTSVSISINNIAHPLCNAVLTGSATATGSGGASPYTYNWNTIPAQTTSTATNLGAGSYTVTVIDANGCTASQIVTISQPGLLSTTTSVVNVGCNGNSSGSASVTATGGTPTYTYLWNTVPAQTGATATALSAGSYSVTVTDINGCSTIANVTISQPSTLSVNTTVTTIFCAGGTANASGIATGGTLPYSYGWNTSPVQTTSTAVSLQPGVYTITVTDGKGCSATASATVAPPLPPVTATVSNFSNVHCFGGNDGSATVSVTGGTSPYNYNWNTIPSQGTATATGLTAGVYTVIVTDNNGCNDTASVTIGAPDPIIINAQALNKTCIGNSDGAASVAVSGGVAPYGISWNTNPVQNTDTVTQLAPGTYIVTITDGTGCVRTATVNIENYPAANIHAGDDKIICEGESITLHATGGISYWWTPADSLSCSNCSDPVASPANTMSFSVTGVDINNCRDSDIVEVVVLHPKPMAVGTEKKICAGDTTSLFASGGGTYSWSPSAGLNNSHIPNPTASPSATTQYYVIISQNQCYTDTLEQLVTVYQRPTVELGPDHQGMAGSVFQINSQTTNANSISWTPVTGLSCEACFDPLVTLENSITYTATVSNELGCTAKDQINIRVVCDNSVFFVANTFTPNGDGNNDLFFPQGRGIKTISSFKVYNRWGEVMYQASNFSPNEVNYGWDGKYKGVALNPDVYVYMISGICQNGDPVSIKGDISLLR